MDVTSSNTNWIFAAKSGSAINSDSTSATITQHANTYGTMSLDLTKAVDSANTNPFTNSTTASTGSTGSTGSDCDTSGGSSSTNGGATPTSSSGGSFGPFGSSFPSGFTPPWATGSSNKRAAATSNACPSSGATSNGGVTQLGSLNVDTQNQMIKAHAIMACLAFAVLFPFGAISIRLLSFPGLVVVHALFQIVAYLVYIIAFGLGVYLATQMRIVSFTHL
jgi:hypothetical protein